MKKFISLLAATGFFITGSIFAQTGTYVVLTTINDTTDAYYDAVRTIRDYRNAQVIQFNAAEIDSLIPVLTAIQPRYAAIVLEPMDMDINFVRKFMMMSTQLDSDPFSDFSYGYITGANAQDAINFVDTIIYAETHNIVNFPLNVSGFTASSLNLVFTTPGDYLTYLNPPSYSSIYTETNDNGVGVSYFNSNTTYLANNKLLDVGHNGDPHMLWLFEGGNSNPNPPVWNFDPAKIEDPAYARVGISSYEIDDLNLYPAVVYNGACHSGEPKNVMVETDIAATFGDVSQIEFYAMSDTFSFALTMLNTGITGYFAPCGANNANEQGEDVYNTFLYQEPLGDIHKRSNDGVIMGFLGNSPKLKIFIQGGSLYGCDILTSGSFNPASWSGACYMLGGKANKVYFGDPLYNPFENNHDPQLEIITTALDSIDPTTLDIDIMMDKPDVYFPLWDKFHYGDTRVYAAVELPDYCGDILSFDVIDSSGAYHMVFYAMEEFDGKTIMHIELDIPDDYFYPIIYNMTIRITFTNITGVNISVDIPDLLVYPNPAEDIITIKFHNPDNENCNIVITDINGRIVDMAECNSVIYHYQADKLQPGMYFIQLWNSLGTAGSGKFIKK
ncbi:MAG: T9SS type A sorting domain-containing protein [Bacteroidota bacterium]